MVPIFSHSLLWMNTKVIIDFAKRTIIYAIRPLSVCFHVSIKIMRTTKLIENRKKAEKTPEKYANCFQCEKKNNRTATESECDSSNRCFFRIWSNY